MKDKSIQSKSSKLISQKFSRTYSTFFFFFFQCESTPLSFSTDTHKKKRENWENGRKETLVTRPFSSGDGNKKKNKEGINDMERHIPDVSFSLFLSLHLRSPVDFSLFYDRSGNGQTSDEFGGDGRGPQ